MSVGSKNLCVRMSSAVLCSSPPPPPPLSNMNFEPDPSSTDPTDHGIIAHFSDVYICACWPKNYLPCSRSPWTRGDLTALGAAGAFSCHRTRAQNGSRLCPEVRHIYAHIVCFAFTHSHDDVRLLKRSWILHDRPSQDSP